MRTPEHKKIYHWTQIQTFSWHLAPTPAMLLSEGEVFPIKCLLKGEARGNGAIMRYFRFDKEYVLKYIQIKLLIPLYVLGLEENLEIIKEAHDAIPKQGGQDELEF